MWGRPFWLALIAGVGAFLAWAISQPYLPYAPIDLHAPIESQFALGTFWGWFSNLLFGALVCGPLAFLIAEPRTTTGRAFLCGLVGLVLGAGLVCGADALSDWLDIRLLHATGETAAELYAFTWYAFVGIATSFSVALVCQPNGERLLRALAAAAIGAVAGYVLRWMLLPLEALLAVGNLVGKSNAQMAKTNMWAIYSPSELIQNVAMAMVMGFILGAIEIFARKAWIRLECGHNEGRDYGLDRPEIKIGSAEGADVFLAGDPSVMPWHARVTQSADGYWIMPVTGEVLLNGLGVGPSLLSHGDRIQVGSRHLLYLERAAQKQGYITPRGYEAPASPLPKPVEEPVFGVNAFHATPPPRPFTLQTEDGQELLLRPGVNTLGREPGSVLNLGSDNSASRAHAEILVSGSIVTLRDLGSRNGTFLNRTAIQASVRLQDGDAIQIGGTTVTFRGGSS